MPGRCGKHVWNVKWHGTHAWNVRGFGKRVCNAVAWMGSQSLLMRNICWIFSENSSTWKCQQFCGEIRAVSNDGQCPCPSFCSFYFFQAKLGEILYRIIEEICITFRPLPQCCSPCPTFSSPCTTFCSSCPTFCSSCPTICLTGAKPLSEPMLEYC